MVNLENVYQPSIFEQARSGDLRAIAYWINSFLVPQGIFVRVGVTRAGNLHLLVEFERQPERDRLLRFICHRLCRLKSDVIDIVRIAVRPAGTQPILWTQSIRLLMPVRRPSTRAVSSQEIRPVRSPEVRCSQVARRDVMPPKLDQRLNPDLSTESNRARATIAKSRVTRKPRPPSAAALRMRRRRSIALGGSAVAAFLIGCGVELSRHQFGSDSESFTATTGSGDRPDTVTIPGDRISVTQQRVLNPADPTVTLTFGSDSALGSSVIPDVASNSITSDGLVSEDATSDGATLDGIIPNHAIDLTNIAGYRQADVVLTNLDSPVVDTAKAGQADPDANAVSLQTLAAGGVDVVNLGGNRLLQASDKALGKALDSLEQSGILSIGAGRNPREARRPEILDVKGQRIAYLGYSDSDVQSVDRSASLNPALNDQIATDIQAIRQQVDWVIVNYHWSKELAEYPGEQQINMARFAIDQGADLVVGHHPDVLQGAEIYRGRAIAYSLGNFIFTDSQDNPKTDYETAVLKVSLANNQMRLEFLPVQVKKSKPEIVSGEKAQQILQYIQQASGLFDQPLESPVTLDLRSPANSPANSSTPAPAIESPAPDASVPSIQAPSSDSFTLPSDSTKPDDSFTTYPQLPTGSAREIRNNDSESSRELEVQDSLDRGGADSAVESIDYKQSEQTESKYLLQEVQELQPQLEPQSSPVQSLPIQSLPIQTESQQPQLAPSESQPTPSMVPATIDTIAAEPLAKPTTVTDSKSQDISAVFSTPTVNVLPANSTADVSSSTVATKPSQNLH
jgi:poly-gamma-glutamate capsule biosynthesis protein CapA/YwtB (metallophosphatase superfamily)